MTAIIRGSKIVNRKNALGTVTTELPLLECYPTEFTWESQRCDWPGREFTAFWTGSEAKILAGRRPRTQKSIDDNEATEVSAKVQGEGGLRGGKGHAGFERVMFHVHRPSDGERTPEADAGEGRGRGIRDGQGGGCQERGGDSRDAVRADWLPVDGNELSHNSSEPWWRSRAYGSIGDMGSCRWRAVWAGESEPFLLFRHSPRRQTGVSNISCGCARSACGFSSGRSLGIGGSPDGSVIRNGP